MTKKILLITGAVLILILGLYCYSSYRKYYHISRGEICRINGDIDGAISEYNISISLDPKSSASYYNLGRAKKARGDLGGALIAFDQAINLSPEEGVYYNDRADTKLAAGDIEGSKADSDQALQVLTRTIQKNPKNEPAYCARAYAKVSRGDLDGAIADYDQAITIDPKNAGANNAYFNRGKAKQERGDMFGAIGDFTEQIKIFPKDDGAYNERGNAKCSNGDFTGAFEDFDKAIELNPKNTIAYYNRGTAKETDGDLPGAISDFSRAVIINPTYDLAYYSRGYAKSLNKDIDGAIADFKKTIEINPRAVNAYYYLGNTERDRGDKSSAVWDYDHAIELNKLNPEYYLSRGLVKLDQGYIEMAIGDFKSAIDACNKAIQDNPKLAMPFYHRGNAKSYLGDIENAIADYKHTIEIDPNGICAYNALAWLLATTDDSLHRNGKIALEYAQKCYELTNKPFYCDTLAAAFAECGKFEDAVQWQNKYFVENSDDKDAHFRMSLYQRQLPYHEINKLALSYYNRANKKWGICDLKGASEDFAKAIGAYPNFASAYYSKGIVEITSGDQDAGLGDFKHANEINSDYYVPSYLSSSIITNTNANDVAKSASTQSPQIMTSVYKTNDSYISIINKGETPNSSHAAPNITYGKSVIYADDKENGNAIRDYLLPDGGGLAIYKDFGFYSNNLTDAFIYVKMIDRRAQFDEKRGYMILISANNETAKAPAENIIGLFPAEQINVKNLAPGNSLAHYTDLLLTIEKLAETSLKVKKIAAPIIEQIERNITLVKSGYVLSQGKWKRESFVNTNSLNNNIDMYVHTSFTTPKKSKLIYLTTKEGEVYNTVTFKFSTKEKVCFSHKDGSANLAWDKLTKADQLNWGFDPENAKTEQILDHKEKQVTVSVSTNSEFIFQNNADRDTNNSSTVINHKALSDPNAFHHFTEAAAALCVLNKGITKDEVNSANRPDGNAPIQCVIGIACRQGVGGMNKNCAEAIRWFHLAADQGFVIGQFLLGDTYSSKENGCYTPNEALKWYKMAAEQGFADAYVRIGNCYADGVGVLQDDIEANKWYKKAANLSNSSGETAIGEEYALGRGVDKNLPEALKYLRKAAENENDQAQLDLAMILTSDELGGLKNPQEAKKWLEKSADHRNPKSIDLLNQIKQRNGL